MQLAASLAAEGDPWSDNTPPSPITGSPLASLWSGFRRRQKPNVTTTTTTARVSSGLDQNRSNGDERRKQRQPISPGRRLANFLKSFRFGSSSGGSVAKKLKMCSSSSEKKTSTTLVDSDSVSHDKANRDEQGEEVQIFRDIPTHSAHDVEFEFEGHDRHPSKHAAHEEQVDFDFDLAFDPPRPPPSMEPDMCVADDIFFMGRIVPHRYFSDDGGTTRTSPSKSRSFEQGPSDGSTTAMGKPSSSARSSNGSLVGRSSSSSYCPVTAAVSVSGENDDGRECMGKKHGFPWSYKCWVAAVESPSEIVIKETNDVATGFRREQKAGLEGTTRLLFRASPSKFISHELGYSSDWSTPATSSTTRSSIGSSVCRSSSSSRSLASSPPFHLLIRPLFVTRDHIVSGAHYNRRSNLKRNTSSSGRTLKDGRDY